MSRLSGTPAVFLRFSLEGLELAQDFSALDVPAPVRKFASLLTRLNAQVYAVGGLRSAIFSTYRTSTSTTITKSSVIGHWCSSHILSTTCFVVRAAGAW